MSEIVLILGYNYDSNCYLIDNKILVDTGAGENKDYLFAKLRENGVELEDIELVVNTHCHFDHIGGLLQNERAVFPNGYIYINQKEYDYFCNTDLNNVSDSTKKRMENVRNIFAKYNPLKLPWVAGLNITVLPVTIAGAIFDAARLTG